MVTPREIAFALVERFQEQGWQKSVDEVEAALVEAEERGRTDTAHKVEMLGRKVEAAMGRYRGTEPLIDAIQRLSRDYHEAKHPPVSPALPTLGSERRCGGCGGNGTYEHPFHYPCEKHEGHAWFVAKSVR